MISPGEIGFGRAFGEKFFSIKPGYVHLNQGSYGGYPRAVRDALRTIQDEVQAEPDGFVRYLYPKRLSEVRASLAEFLHVDKDEVVLVSNATTGLNTVLRNMVFRPGDKIAYVQGIYGATEKTVDYMVETTPVESVCVAFDPIADDDDKLLRAFADVLESHRGHVRLAIFDTVMSMPGLRMPFEGLTRMCERYGVLSVIDGAHGIGMFDLDLGKLNADFLVTNCHKWLFVPHSCAVLYVALRNQHLMRSSMPTSWNFQTLPEILQDRQYIGAYEPPLSTNPFVSQFAYFGTIDNGPSLCIPAALEFRNTVCGGEQKIHEYCSTLAREGELRVTRILETNFLAIPESKRVTFANVRLPLEFGSSTGEAASNVIPVEDVPLVMGFLFQRLHGEYNTFVNIVFVSGSLWARFSAMIYLEMEDFEYGARALKELCRRVVEREYL